MTWHFPQYIIAYLVSAFCSGMFAIFAWRRRSTPGAASFAFLMLAIVDWTAMSVLEVSAVETWAKVFWGRLAYPGIASAGLLWLIFSARFSRYDAWLTKKTIALLWIIPCVTVLLVVTSDWHHLYYTGVTPIHVDDTYSIIYHRGPFFWVHIAYTYLMLLAGSFLLMKAIIRFPRLYRRQVTPILLSIIIPWATNILYILRVGPFSGVDLTPISFTVSGFLFYWSLFHSRMFEIVPTAWDLLVKQVPEGIVVLDNKYRVIDINPSARGFFKAAKSPIGKDARDVFHLWPLLVSHMKSASKERGEIVVEGDPLRVFKFTVSPVNDQYGNVAGRLIVLEDITERKLAEKALRESEANLSMAQRIAHVGSWEWNLLQDRQVWSEETYRILGCKPGTDTPSITKIMNMIQSDYWKDIEQKVRDSIEYNTLYENEYSITTPDGTVKYIRVLGEIVLDECRKPVRFRGAIQDITGQKKMESRLIQSEKLASLGEILSGAAHELNNPLTSVIGYAQILAQKDIPQEVKDKLAIMQRESLRCAKIVSNLLAFAKEHRPKKNNLHVNDVIMEAYELKKYELQVDNVVVNLDLSRELPETYADPNQLKQVFINLISNAHDAIKPNGGGTLTISSNLKGDKIAIEFTDDGIGIQEPYKNKIFDPFFTTKEIGKGVGLGLSTAYGIINAHGGTIDVESKPEKYTKFTIEMSVTSRTADVFVSEEKAAEKPAGNMNILVVDDEKSLLKMITEALTIEGYTVESADNGKDAMELIKKRRFDVVISDIRMPEMDGAEFYRFISTRDPDLASRILFITGDVLGKDTEDFLRTTGNRYIEKPFAINDLLKIVGKIMR